MPLTLRNLVPDQHAAIAGIGDDRDGRRRWRRHSTSSACRRAARRLPRLARPGAEIGLAEHDVGRAVRGFGIAVPDQDAMVPGVGDRQYAVAGATPVGTLSVAAPTSPLALRPSREKSRWPISKIGVGVIARPALAARSAAGDGRCRRRTAGRPSPREAGAARAEQRRSRRARSVAPAHSAGARRPAPRARPRADSSGAPHGYRRPGDGPLRRCCGASETRMLFREPHFDAATDRRARRAIATAPPARSGIRRSTRSYWKP